VAEIFLEQHRAAQMFEKPHAVAEEVGARIDRIT
jgi:hypothetical protein